MIFKKVCLLGDFAVGKTSLVRWFVDRQFSDNYLSTVGVKISRKLLMIPSSPQNEATEVQLIIWDLEGNSKFRQFSSSYLKGSNGAIVVADLSRSETVERAKTYLKEFHAINPAGDVAVALNKSDLVDIHQISRLRNPEAYGRVITVCATSAKTGSGIDNIFELLGKTLVETNTP